MPNNYKTLIASLFLPSILPVGITIFYTFPALMSYFKSGDPHALTVLMLSVACTILYILFWISKIDLLVFNFAYAFKKRSVELSGLALWICSFYILLITYTSYTAPSIPLIDAIRGMNIDTIAGGRETFLRSRIGFEVSLNYMYSMFRSFLMPFAVCILYHEHSKLRHIALAIFLLSLILTLEKSLSILALLPLFYLFFQKQDYKRAVVLVLLTFTSVGLTSYLARGGAEAPDKTSITYEPEKNPTEKNVEPKIIIAKSAADSQSMATLPEKYNMFSGNSQVEYILNRVLYIPYMTAHEWIRYKHEVMNDGYTLGRSISLVAILLGEKKINLERDVFTFQWGQNNTATGSANTAYFIDAYLNFGTAGCLLYTFTIVCILRLTTKSNIATLQACIFVPMIFLLFNSLTAMIFSGGLFLLILLALFFSQKNRSIVTHTE
ncbi:hypothetical protein [Pseudomonas mandelii]|uniref:hypothetical protein n=1 Tax=Pseudomonas mandelii TaxID=75612 RepID=UPI003C70D6AF